MFRIVPLLVISMLAVLSGQAAAAPADTGTTDAAVEDQISQGIALRRAGNDEAALGIFLNLEKRAPESVRLLLHICTAALATGRWTMAYDYLQKAQTHRDEPYYQRHRGAIDNVERTIVQRVGQFRARGSPPGAEVRLNGELVGTLPMAGAKVLEVGSYMLEVSKQGYFSVRRPVTIDGDGSLTQEAVELREAEQAGPALESPGRTLAQSAPPADRAPLPPAAWWRSRAVTWTLAGIGVAAAATSIVSFGVREQDANHWNDNSCLDATNVTRTRQDVCPSLRQDINLAQGIGVAAGTAALVFGGGALVHWLVTSHDQSSENASGPHPAVACSPALGSVLCTASF